MAYSGPEFAPIIERSLEFYDLTLKTPDGRDFNLRQYLTEKQLVIVAFVAAWCRNSNENGHVVKGLYDTYKDRGLGVVIVAEYSSDHEIRTHINRIGIDYPVVIETDSRRARKRSVHYRYRSAVGDGRRWGTPFYVIIDRRDIEESADRSLLARRVHTVSGEIIEAEARGFIEKRLDQGHSAPGERVKFY